MFGNDGVGLSLSFVRILISHLSRLSSPFPPAFKPSCTMLPCSAAGQRMISLAKGCSGISSAFCSLDGSSAPPSSSRSVMGWQRYEYETVLKTPPKAPI